MNRFRVTLTNPRSANSIVIYTVTAENESDAIERAQALQAVEGEPALCGELLYVFRVETPDHTRAKKRRDQTLA
jgi:hypothetical protein